MEAIGPFILSLAGLFLSMMALLDEKIGESLRAIIERLSGH